MQDQIEQAIEDRRADSEEKYETSASCFGDGKNIICPSPAMEKVYQAVARIAPTDATPATRQDIGRPIYTTVTQIIRKIAGM